MPDPKRPFNSEELRADIERLKEQSARLLDESKRVSERSDAIAKKIGDIEARLEAKKFAKKTSKRLGP
jgi:chromosome segregation ATPase